MRYDYGMIPVSYLVVVAAWVKKETRVLGISGRVLYRAGMVSVCIKIHLKATRRRERGLILIPAHQYSQ